MPSNLAAVFGAAFRIGQLSQESPSQVRIGPMRAGRIPDGQNARGILAGEVLPALKQGRVPVAEEAANKQAPRETTVNGIPRGTGLWSVDPGG